MNYIIVTSNHNQETVKKKVESFLDKSLDLDYIFISPKEGKYLIDDIRSFLKKLNITRLQKKVPVYVILNADLMQPIVQNSILKALEESKNTIVLTVSNISSLLPTVRSRCIEIFDKFEPQDLNKNIELDIENLLKMDRAELIKTLSEFQYSIDKNENNFSVKILALERAIRLLQSNCKIEAVLMELNRKINFSK